MQPPLEQPLKGRPTGPFYVTLVESTLFDGKSVEQRLLTPVFKLQHYMYWNPSQFQRAILIITDYLFIFSVMVWQHLSALSSILDFHRHPNNKKRRESIKSELFKKEVHLLKVATFQSINVFRRIFSKFCSNTYNPSFSLRIYRVQSKRRFLDGHFLDKV